MYFGCCRCRHCCRWRRWCATFTTLMQELHGSKMYVYGGSPAVSTIQYKGMAGNQVSLSTSYIRLHAR